MRKEKSSGLILYRQAAGVIEYLVLHYGTGHWSFCKGHVESGETDLETALRELEEETSIRPDGVAITDGFSTQTTYSFSRGRQKVDKLVVFMLAGIKDEPKIKLSKEHSEFAWLSFKDATARLTYDSDRQVLAKAHAFLTKV